MLREVLAAEFIAREGEELEQWLHDLGIPAERLRTIDEGLAITRAQGRQLTADCGVKDSTGQAVQVPLAPFTLSSGGAVLHSAPPVLGQHTDEILGELDVDAFTIKTLRALGVI
jgi:crotonobetainyl-CoA:carnitine CoA-transferase CaiB-like acyl-CoA transferase